MMGRSKLLTWSRTAEIDTEHKTYLELKKAMVSQAFAATVSSRNKL